jgi:hypothetical protein
MHRLFMYVLFRRLIIVTLSDLCFENFEYHNFDINK